MYILGKKMIFIRNRVLHEWRMKRELKMIPFEEGGGGKRGGQKVFVAHI